MNEKKKNVPQLRFPGFTDAWEQRKLEEMAEFNPKSTLPDKFEYVDLESVVGTELVGHREERRASAPSRAQRLAKMDDIFYQMVRPYQKNNYLFDLPYDNYVFSTGYAQLRPKNNGYFLLTLVQNENFVSRVMERCTGTSYPAINSKDLAVLTVTAPKDTFEQQKIGTFFQQLDNLITLHQRKLSDLKKLKNGLLQKMFPKNGEKYPEIRFPEFTDAWEQRKLSNCCTITGGNAWKSSDYSSTGDYLVVTIANVQGQKYINDKVGNRISVVNPGKYLLKQEDMLVSLTGNVGRVSRMTDTPAVLNQRVGLIKPKTNEVSDEFLFQVLSNNAFESSMVARGQGAAQANISNNDVLSYELLVPKDVREQTNVARLFRYFDTTIALHQRELDHLQLQKKALLQQMFV